METLISTTHALNEELRRFEPIDSKCMFCDRGHSQEMSDNCFVSVYLEKKRLELLIYSSVKYNEIVVGVPRCPDCRRKHNEAKRRANRYGWGVAALVIATGIVLSVVFKRKDIFFMVSIPVSVLTGIFVSHRTCEALFKRKGISNEEEGARKYEFVRILLHDGWSFTRPSA